MHGSVIVCTAYVRQFVLILCHRLLTCRSTLVAAAVCVCAHSVLRSRRLARMDGDVRRGKLSSVMSTGERTLGYLTKTTVAARFVCVAYALLFLPVQLCIHFIDSSNFSPFFFFLFLASFSFSYIVFGSIVHRNRRLHDNRFAEARHRD